MIWTIIVTLVGGLIIGLLGKAVAPGDRDHIPLWLTVVCGIGGMLLGSLLYYWIFGVNDNVRGNPDYGWDNTTKGIDWWRHIFQVIVAVIAVIIAASLYPRARART